MLRRSPSSQSMDVESDAHNTSSVENGVFEEAVVSCGPWGGQGGTQFCDGRGDIVEIVVTHTSEHIMCIQSSYNQGGANFKASAHGTSTEGQKSEITLQWPDEYVVQVKGTTDTCATIGVVVTSLTFITNKQVYGPYGNESGQRFESLPGGKVVGFFGKSGTLLDQLGVLTQHSELHSTPSLLVSAEKGKNVIDDNHSIGAGSGSATVEGPWGGVGGSSFHDGHGRVVEIFITYQKNQITSFQATYEHGGVHFKGSLHGIASGTRTKIALKPSEYLLQVKGTAGKIFGSEAITSLIFVTNQRVFGPYGRFTGRAFESSSEIREVSGFFGRCGSRLDQIGVITKLAQCHNFQNVTTTDLTVAVQGPWGGRHGSQFCSGRGELEDIYVTFNKVHIVALQATYNLGPKVNSIRSDCWGGNIGETVQVRLRSRGEIVTQLKGTIGVLHNGTAVVTSLTFITNKGVYGPYGPTIGNGFESTPGKVVGFYGRSDSLLHQIGVITETSSSESRDYIERPRSSVKSSSTSTASDVTTDKGFEASQETKHGIFNSSNDDENHKISLPSQSSSSTSRIANGGHTKLSHQLDSGYESIDSGNSLHVEEEEIKACSLDQDGTEVHGPWGGLGGDVFCDGRGEIVEILVTFNTQQVVSLQVSYAHGSSTFRGTSHGGHGDHTAKICLRHPEEYLAQVKGTTGSFPSGDGITSLMFITNENMYGPFGCSITQMGTSFQSPSGSQKVTGFFGRSCTFLNQLGVFTGDSKDSDLGNTGRTVEGPWGGLGGAPFYDGSGDIIEMVVAYNETQIISFQTTYGHSGLGFTTGISAHPRHDTTKINMHFMNEYLVQVKGTVGFTNGSGEVITSLTFVTNKKSYGPYGNVQGLGFESSSNGKVVGFFGKSGSQLDQIGVIKEYVVEGKDFVVTDGGHWEGNSWKEFFNEPGASTSQGSALNNVVVQGPWGGQGGDTFYDGRGDIVEIVITHNQSQILSFQASYDQGGVDFQAENHGGGNGAVATIKLDIPDEYLVQVQGTVGSVLQENVITSLTFITNKHRYGPYGSVSGRKFHSSSSGCIVGFYGRSSSASLDQLGFIKSIMASQKLMIDSKGIMGTSSTIQYCDHDVSSDVLVIPQGPWGGCGGHPFYDGRGEIVDLNINFTDTLITSIQVGYEQGGNGFQGGLHGGKGIRQVKIHMNSEEILLQVHGTSATVNGLHGITSLAFATNKRVYGPYGTVHGRKFQSSPGRQVVGFFGQSSDIVNQLGVVTLIFTSAHSTRCKYYSRHNHSRCRTHNLSLPKQNRYSREEIYHPSLTGAPTHALNGTVNHVQHQLPGLLTYKQTKTNNAPNQADTATVEPSDGNFHKVTPDVPGREHGSDDGTEESVCPGPHTQTPQLVDQRETSKPGGEDGTSTTGIHDFPTGTVDPAFEPVKVTPDVPGREHGSDDGTEESVCPGPQTYLTHWHINNSLKPGGEDGTSTTGIHEFPTGSVDPAIEPVKVTPDVPGREHGSDDGTEESVCPGPQTYLTHWHINNSLKPGGEDGTSTTGIHDFPTGTVDPAFEPVKVTPDVPGREHGSDDGTEESVCPGPHTQTPQLVDQRETSKPGGEDGTSTTSIHDFPTGTVDPAFADGQVMLEISDWVPCVFTGGNDVSFGHCLESVLDGISAVDSELESPRFGGVAASVLSDSLMSVKWDSESVSRSSYSNFSESSEASQFSDSSKSSHSSHASVVSESSRSSKPSKLSESSKLSKPSRSSNSFSKLFKSMVSNSGFELKHGFYDRSKVEIGDERPSYHGTSDELHGLSNNSTSETIGSSSGEEFIFEGPWGGECGLEFNRFMVEGGFKFYGCSGEIVEIQVFHTKSHLTGMLVRYCTSRSRFEGQKYGENGPFCSKILLDSSNEYIIRVSGTYARVRGYQIITSISFNSNKAVYGPYGMVVGEKFSSSGSRKVVGFFGRAGSFIHQIGVVYTRERQAKKPEGEVIVQGPWGGEEGLPFYDGRGDIAEILVEYTDDHIISLQVTYEQDASIFKTNARFGPGGNTFKIKLDPQEHLLQIQGSIGDSFSGDMVNSLTFVTTKQKYGPFGSDTINKFESKMHGKIVGFYGRSDEFLYRVGVITEVLPENPVIVLSQGPWGGQNGTSFYDGKGEVVGINITYNKKQIISLQTIYGQGDAVFEAHFHGGPGGKTAKILFKAPNEELLQVKGTTGKVDGELVITSLTFKSNQREYGPFGRVRSTEFESSPNGKVHGLHGKAKNCLVQIGFFTTFPSEKCAGQIVAQGPWGGLGGHVFYEGRGNLLGITVGYSETHIISLQMTYEHNGTEYEGERHGGSGGQLTQISLKESGSYLVQVKGTFGKIGGEVSVTSVMFITNKDSFGPFGTARGHQFQSSRQGKVVGFFGNSSALIDQLGVVIKLHAKSHQIVPPTLSMGPWGGQGGKAFHDGEGDIHEIHVQYSSSHINSLQVVYKQGDTVLHAAKHGKTSGGSRIKIPFTAPGEYLTQIKGTYGQVSEDERITSLTFISNEKQYGPFGEAAGTNFQSPSGTRIVGIFGRAGASVDQIGVVVQAIEASKA